MATKWAICGAGNICNDFCTALSMLPDTEHQIVAVAARSEERSAKFAKKFGIQKSFGSYEALADSEDIDVVYIGVITSKHVETTLLFINAGKNVVSETPMALSLEGCRTVLDAAKRKGVFFLEGYWTRFHPIYDLIMDQIRTGAIGDVQMVHANLSAPLQEYEPLDPSTVTGPLLAIGIYSLTVADLIFGEVPEKVQSDIPFNKETGKDMGGVITLRYSGTRFAILTTTGNTPMEDNSLLIRGTKGHIKIPDTFWAPTSVILPDGQLQEWSLPDPPEGHDFFYPRGQWFRFEAEAVRDALCKGLKECPKLPHEVIERTMGILDQVLKQNGIQFPTSQ